MGVFEDIALLQTQVATLENKVAALERAAVTDSGWLTLPLTEGIQSYGSSVPQYRRIGKIVIIRGAVKNVLASGVIATLPEGYRPTYSVPYVQNTSMRTGNFAMFSRMLVGSDGKIRVEAITDGATFSTDRWIPIHCVFMID